MEANTNANKESPEFSTFDGMSSPLENEKKESKKLNLKLILIISGVILSIILIIIIILVIINSRCGSGYYVPEDDQSVCLKCSVDNCDECSGTKESNICSSCKSKFFPVYEIDVLKSCNPCCEGCSYCDQEKHECTSCNLEYDLRNGICIPTYSFMAKYYVDSSSKSVSLVNYDFRFNIKEVKIDGEIQTDTYSSYNLKKGKHTVYVLLDKNIKSLENMFFYCEDLTEISFSPLFKNMEIKSVESMFDNCESLTSIDFTHFKIKNVSILDRMFSYCLSLTSINFSNMDISKATSMRSMFYNCRKLQKIEFPKVKTKELQNMEQMFTNCESLESLDLSNFDTRQVTTFFFYFINAKA